MHGSTYTGPGVHGGVLPPKGGELTGVANLATCKILLALAAVQLFTREARASKLSRMMELSIQIHMFIAYFI